MRISDWSSDVCSSDLEPDRAPFRRYDDADIAKMDEFEQPKYDPEAADRRMKRATFAKQLDAFLKTEGALAYATMSSRDGKLIHGTGYLFASGDSQAMPGFEIAAEDYRRLARLAKVGPAPAVEMTRVAHYDDSDSKAYNIMVAIQGSDHKAGFG